MRLLKCARVKTEGGHRRPTTAPGGSGGRGDRAAVLHGARRAGPQFPLPVTRRESLPRRVPPAEGGLRAASRKGRWGRIRIRPHGAASSSRPLAARGAPPASGAGVAGPAVERIRRSPPGSQGARGLRKLSFRFTAARAAKGPSRGLRARAHQAPARSLLGPWRARAALAPGIPSKAAPAGAALHALAVRPLGRAAVLSRGPQARARAPSRAQPPARADTDEAHEDETAESSS